MAKTQTAFLARDMEKLSRIGPATSFAFCFLGGAVLLVNGLNKDSGLLSGIGLFFIGIAFFVGPVLWLAANKHSSEPDTK